MEDKENISFEAALEKLEEVVRRLEEGQISLEESLELFTEGIRLSKICNERLNTAEKKIQLLINNEEGEPVIDEADGSFNGGT